MKNNLKALNDNLFATIGALMAEDKPMDPKTGMAVAAVAKQILDGAKLQMDYMKQTGNISRVEVMESAETRKELH